MDLSNLPTIAANYGLPVNLLAAFIAVESSGNPYAWRTEPAYSYLWDCTKNTPFRKLTPAENTSEKCPADFHALIGSDNTEWLGQQASWGPMQLMGAVARERGFTGHFPELCGDVGIEFAAEHLKHYYDKFYKDKGWPGVISAYNAGSPSKNVNGQYVNQQYINKVMAAWDR